MAHNGQNGESEALGKPILAVIKGKYWEIRHIKKWELKYNKGQKFVECPYCKRVMKKYNKVLKYLVCKSCKKLFLKEIYCLTEVKVSKIES